MLRSMILPALLGLGLTGLVLAGPAMARTGCDSYGRCFDFAGPSDRLGDAEALWQRADVTEPTDAADPLALAHGSLGDRLQDLSDDD